jgi:2-succinyl-6-hydroxy-2,4-cyclohexadiene-1-carboxylate synthase
MHGFMGSSEDWRPIVYHFEDRYYCVAVDLPGHGASTDVPAAAYAMEGTAQALCDVLDTLRIQRCTPIGYSMGGRTALFFALQFPERCERLVLESASPGLATQEERAARRGVDEARAVRLESEGMPTFLDDWYRQPLFASLLRKGDYVRQMLQRRVRNDAHALARSLRGMGTGQQPSLWERLPTLQVSTLALAGALDGKYVDLARRMAVRSPRLRSTMIADAGHVIHAERPARFVEVVSSFLPPA